jgi:hypothetical protein
MSDITTKPLTWTIAIRKELNEYFIRFLVGIAAKEQLLSPVLIKEVISYCSVARNVMNVELFLTIRKGLDET